MFSNAGAMKGAVVSVEVYDAAQKRQELVLTGKLPSVEVRVLRDMRRSATVRRTGRAGAEGPELPDFDRSSEIGVAAEEFDFILGLGYGCHTSNKRGENKEPEEN